MVNKRVSLVGALLITGALAVTACAGASSTTSSSATSTSGASATTTTGASGSVTPSGAVHVGPTWMMTVYSAQAYPNGWHAPAGMPGDWGHMGRGYMAVVFDTAAQTSATPVPDGGTAYAGPICALRGGWGMMGSSWMGTGYYGWRMMSAGNYRGPVAFMASTSTRQYTLVCTDRATGQQASWNIGFNQNLHTQIQGGGALAVSPQRMQPGFPRMTQQAPIQGVSPRCVQYGPLPMPHASPSLTSTGTQAWPGTRPTTSGTMHSGPGQPVHMSPYMHR